MPLTNTQITDLLNPILIEQDKQKDQHDDEPEPEPKESPAPAPSGEV
mgnify:CR=1 FL=1